VDREIAKGFTLLELVIAIVVTVVLLSIAISNFIAWKRKIEIEKDVNTIYSVIQKCRLKALTSHTGYELYFENSGRTLIVNGTTLVSYKLSFPFTFRGSVNKLKIDDKGVVDNLTIYSKVAGLDNLNPKYDCIVISSGINVRKGKWNGTSCK